MFCNSPVRTRWLFGFAAAACLAGTPALVAAGQIDWQLSPKLETARSVDVFVKMASDARLDQAENLVRAERAQFVHDELRRHADVHQAGVQSLLKRRGIEYRVFWINNSLFIRNASPALVHELAARDDVAYVRGNYEVPLHVPQPAEGTLTRGGTVEWNIDIINAPQVWQTGNTGQGAVVANIDTGVRYTHGALIDSYRGNNGDGSFTHDYNWFDPRGTFLNEPADNNGHGTHTMGTMVGGDGLGPFTNDIGVAPDARWIAAKGCESNSCSDFSLISAAQWVACPTRVDGSDPDCSTVPDVVNNSWGGGGGDPWYTSYVDSWVSAGIIPVFSAGNSGPSCSSLGTPGDYSNVIGVGGTDINDSNYDFSSRGPGSFRRFKPDFVAPGENVRSAVNNSNGSYSNFSGTSMAAPHVAGTIALMLTANPNATLTDIYRAFVNSTAQTLIAPTGPQRCGIRFFNQYPNFIYGWGRIDAPGAVQAIVQ